MAPATDVRTELILHLVQEQGVGGLESSQSDHKSHGLWLTPKAFFRRAPVREEYSFSHLGKFRLPPYGLLLHRHLTGNIHLLEKTSVSRYFIRNSGFFIHMAASHFAMIRLFILSRAT